MKTRTWIVLLAVLLVLCIGISALLAQPGNAAYAKIYSQGKLLYTLPLAVDNVLTVKTETGSNVITVSGGKIAVTEATCPDGHCKNRGFCSGGSPIVCLPNRLVIQFTGAQSVDGVSG